VPWNDRYNELAEYNAVRGRAAGSQYRYDATPEERMETRERAQKYLNSLPTDYVLRMAALQEEYNETVLGYEKKQSAQEGK